MTAAEEGAAMDQAMMESVVAFPAETAGAATNSSSRRCSPTAPSTSS